MTVDPKLYEFATPRQAEYLDALQHHGSARSAEKALGLSRDLIARAVRKIKARAARMGYAPGHFEHGIAPGYLMGKVTVQRSGDGTVERTWERQSPDQARMLEALEAAVEAMCAKIQPVAPVASPLAVAGDLCALYTLTDAHIGMLAWHREGGQDWDLEIAERVIVGCIAETIRQMPAAKYAVFNQLGDLLHYDSLQAITPTSGHILDADSRYTKMVEVAVRVMRQVIAMLLAKHERVHVIMAEGNHDMASSVWLRTMFKALYENEPRITVDDSALPYYVYQHGEVMLGFHHSHLKKNPALPGLFAAQFPSIWGNTRKRYCHTGNLHHGEEKEHAGMTVIQHPTLAARDAYAARGGWMAERAMSAITYHVKYGQVGRVTVTPEMLGGQYEG